MPETPPLRERLLPLVLFGWAIAALRYLAEFIAPDQSMWFGVYYLMPVALLYIGWRGSWGAIRWPLLLLTMLLLAFAVWGVWNTISYTTGQFAGWQHGRFAHGRAAPIADSALGKVGYGLMQGALTSVAATIWCTVFGTLLIWLPGRLRQRQPQRPAQ